MMTTVDDTLFQLVRVSLFDNQEVTLYEWKSVFAEMKAQSIAALPCVWLRKNVIPGTSVWLSYCTIQQANWIKLMYGQSQLLSLLESNSISCVIIKGSSAAAYYPHPSLRAMGDVDFLVKREDFEKTAALLEQYGYHLTHAKNPSKYHYAYTKDKIHFELHKRLGIVRESDDSLISLFERGIKDREFKDSEGFRFPVLPDELNGLVLIFHINQHLRRGLGLRQIIDWMMYVDSLSWEKWGDLAPLLKETGMERLAVTVTAMCQKYLGLRSVITDDGSLPVEELMSYILEKGNFGHKAGPEGRTASVTLKSVERGYLLKRLQTGGLRRWNAAKKYPVLRPFAWLYQSFRIIRIFIENKVGPKKIMEERKKGLKQRELIASLGLKVDIMIR